MIENFLRPPRTVGEVLADALRVLGAVGILLAAIAFEPTDAGVVAAALPVLMVPRFLGVTTWLDLTAGATVLVAAWSNVFDLYTEVTGWDIVVHVVCTGVLTLLVYVALARARVVPHRTDNSFLPRVPLLLCPALGLALSALWEMVEWFGHTVITDTISVGYTDTIGDLAAGGVGAATAGMVVCLVRLERPAPVLPAATGGLDDVRMPRRWLVATTEYAGLTAYTGGIGRHYAALLPALVSRGIAVDLVVFAEGDVVADAPLHGVRLVSLVRSDARRRRRNLARRARHLRRIHRAGDYDCVFAPEWMALAARLPRRAPLVTNLATGSKLAHDVSDLRIADLPAGLRGAVRAQQHAEKRQIRRSAGVVAISAAMHERTRQLVGSLPPVEVVRNCIDTAEVQRRAASAAPPPLWPTADGPVVLFLGRAERRKGIVDAVTAYGLLHAREPTARLVIAGAGGDARYEPTRAQLLDTLTEGARTRVTWLGHTPGDELYAAVREADVVMCPSRWEGFGQVALEVKAIGTPLVVTTGSGFDDFCTDGLDCAMVPPADPVALADALGMLLGDPAHGAELAAVGKAQAPWFSAEAVAADLAGAVGRLLGSRR
ncbi:glycosyltransferase family 4 protein [Microbacterium telephonicum]|uniref:D-inositol 3-phosphate glycosyltransferase n=1 Tax=Microbacterium telephonicum TaxID=1714841 RepID=A0A498CA44_9MICO|nr:glycosyltransferase family 4 protein [Microbacterium telephonicum]RLK52572.1 glycosyltransferase involved in cell wall biosynthesis [Microbacterium telephonicum]